jgi:uncharacterized protein (DUF1684 family)
MTRKSLYHLLGAVAISCCPFILHAQQSYKQEIANYRQQYKQDFITEERSPLKGNDTAYLRFFAPYERYKITATFKVSPDAKPFDMPTHSGKTKKFRQYGVLNFKINDTAVQLSVYQNLSLLKEDKEHLFVPFTDGTSYIETYAGGRYIDLSIKDIKNNKIVIDFNKCYNPYCAFADGYNCPIPPVENRLPVAIPAGEKLFGKEH